ncbi:MAG TPA: cytochrome c, partial [Flavobacterium sp.]|nr:cytochrome c [Flavobacterium sp.]
IISRNNDDNILLHEVHQLLKIDSGSAPVIVFLAAKIAQFNKKKADSLLADAVRLYPNNRFVTDAVLTNLQGREAEFSKTVNAIHQDTSLLIHRQLKKLLAAIEQSKNDASFKALASKYPRGMNIYRSICQTCHGSDGNGLASLAPPLNRSEWVTGDKQKLAAIVLYGMTGPVRVNDRLYKSPEVLDEMPGIANNKELTNEDIAQLLSFIRNAWSNKAGEINSTDVDKARRKYAGRQKTFTAEELQKN